jgi:hypothetical protein
LKIPQEILKSVKIYKKPKKNASIQTSNAGKFQSKTNFPSLRLVSNRQFHCQIFAIFFGGLGQKQISLSNPHPKIAPK